MWHSSLRYTVNNRPFPGGNLVFIHFSAALIVRMTFPLLGVLFFLLNRLSSLGAPPGTQQRAFLSSGSFSSEKARPLCLLFIWNWLCGIFTSPEYFRRIFFHVFWGLHLNACGIPISINSVCGVAVGASGSRENVQGQTGCTACKGYCQEKQNVRYGYPTSLHFTFRNTVCQAVCRLWS